MAHHLSVIRKLMKKPPHWGWVGDLYLAGNDDGVAMRILDGQDYEPQSRKLWRALCKDADLVIDVGAHTGIYTIDAWKAGARQVLSIEPYVFNAARLMMNVRHAGFKTYNCVIVAASNQNCDTTLKIGNNRDYCFAGGNIEVAFMGGIEMPIQARRLDTLLNKELHANVKAVKIDTERHGVKVLQGMPEILSHKPDLILECIEEGMTEILAPLGYRFYRIEERIQENDGLVRVDALIPDNPFTFDCPNRYATTREL